MNLIAAKIKGYIRKNTLNFSFSRMSQNLRRTIVLLEFVSKIKNKKLRYQNLQILGSNINVIKALREIAFNIVNKNVDLPIHTKRKLKNHKAVLVALSKKARSKSYRKKLVVQAGGALPFLIPLVLNLLGTVV